VLALPWSIFQHINDPLSLFFCHLSEKMLVKFNQFISFAALLWMMLVLVSGSSGVLGAPVAATGDNTDQGKTHNPTVDNRNGKIPLREPAPKDHEFKVNFVLSKISDQFEGVKVCLWFDGTEETKCKSVTLSKKESYDVNLHSVKEKPGNLKAKVTGLGGDVSLERLAE
jgi:hypothetical protein